MADIYEPYFDYDADGDELAADKLRRIVERLLELASEDDTAAALAASVLRNAQTYEELRPTGERTARSRRTPSTSCWHDCWSSIPGSTIPPAPSAKGRSRSRSR